MPVFACWNDTDITGRDLQENSGIPEAPSGPKPTALSPPFELCTAPDMRSIPWADSPSELKEEAAYTIPGECERLFCDRMAAIFLGEGSFVRPESFGMDAPNIRPDGAEKERTCIERWIEVLDYTSDAVYRGFVGSVGGEQTLFVFFEEGIPGYNLKTGYVYRFVCVLFYLGCYCSGNYGGHLLTSLSVRQIDGPV